MRRPSEGSDLKSKQLIANLALGVIGQQVKVDVAMLQASANRGTEHEMTPEQFDALLVGADEVAE